MALPRRHSKQTLTVTLDMRTGTPEREHQATLEPLAPTLRRNNSSSSSTLPQVVARTLAATSRPSSLLVRTQGFLVPRVVP